MAVTRYYLYELRSVCVLSDNLEYLLIRHLSSPSSARLKEFYYTSKAVVPAYQIAWCRTIGDHSAILTTVMTLYLV